MFCLSYCIILSKVFHSFTTSYTSPKMKLSYLPYAQKTKHPPFRQTPHQRRQSDHPGSTAFKTGSAILLVLTAIFCINIFRNTKDLNKNQPAAVQPQVLEPLTAKSRRRQIRCRCKATQYKKGDTLFSIAQQFDSTWEAIATANSLKAPYSLHAGMALQIPEFRKRAIKIEHKLRKEKLTRSSCQFL